MKCGFNAFVWSATCWSKGMKYMMSGSNCGEEWGQRRSSNCWQTRETCGSSSGGVREATLEVRYSVPQPSEEKSRDVPVTDESSNIVDALLADPRFETLAKAATAAGLVETLQAEGPFTVFAPTNEAFAKLPDGALDDLLKEKNKKKLVSTLTYHVVAGKLMASDIESSRIKTENGLKATVKVTAAGETRIDNARVVETDITVANGVIHVIDEVILPPSVD